MKDGYHARLLQSSQSFGIARERSIYQDVLVACLSANMSGCARQKHKQKGLTSSCELNSFVKYQA